LSLDVSILVVSYNTRELTLAALRSVFEQTSDVSFEVVVVDNASRDGSADAVAAEFGERVNLVRSEQNLGFAGGNNLAASHAAGRWLLLLNPDTVVLDAAIDRWVRVADEHPEHKIYGGRTVFADGSLNPTSAWAEPTVLSMVLRGLGVSALMRRSSVANPEMMPRWDRTSAREVDIVSGCFLLIDHELWRELGGFDESFRLYAEEFDLCLRARGLGAHPYVLPEATIIHLGGASDRVLEDQTVRQYAARVMLMRKHWRPVSAWIGTRALDLWAFNKLTRARIQKALSRKHDLDAWRRIWRRRREWHTPDSSRHLSPSGGASA